MYFENFPIMYYSLDNNQSGQIVTDILRRINLITEVTEQNVLYEKYEIQDGDTPEILADKFYGSSNLGWVILLTNNILDPRFEWPMDWYRLNNYINKKYPSNLFLQGNVVSNFKYGETITGSNGAVAKVVGGTGNRLLIIAISGTWTVPSNTITADVSGYVANTTNTGNVFELTRNEIHHFRYLSNSTIIDGTTFNNGNQLEMEAITKREYEIQLNDNRRSIKILKPEYVGRLVEEFKNLVNV